MTPFSERLKKQRLVALCVAGFLALNYPLLLLFNRAELLLGIPVLFFYLFTFWFLFILLMALIMERDGSRPEEG